MAGNGLYLIGQQVDRCHFSNTISASTGGRGRIDGTQMEKLIGDGITHINIYSAGETELGRALSNFSYFPFEMPEDGHFNCIEGYWYWLLIPESNPRRNDLRVCQGHIAKQLGRDLLREYINAPPLVTPAPVFKKKILTAIRMKAENPKLRKMLVESSLPFDHYYVYGNKKVKPSEHWWVIEEWELIRQELKAK